LKFANHLVMQDTVRNLLRIKATIDELESEDSDKATRLSYTCKWVKASEGERICKELLLGQTFSVSTTGSNNGPQESDRDRERRDREDRMRRMFTPPWMQQMQQGQPGMGTTTTGTGPQTSVTASAAQQRGKRPTYIASNETSNTVLVTGPADRVSEAEAILKKIDIETPGRQKVVVGPPQLKIYTVAAGTAEAYAKTLGQAYAASNVCRITTAGQNKVLVYATPEDQISIAKQIGDSETTESGSKTETISIGDLDLEKITKTLNEMFGEVKT